MEVVHSGAVRIHPEPKRRIHPEAHYLGVLYAVAGVRLICLYQPAEEPGRRRRSQHAQIQQNRHSPHENNVKMCLRQVQARKKWDVRCGHLLKQMRMLGSEGFCANVRVVLLVEALVEERDMQDAMCR